MKTLTRQQADQFSADQLEEVITELDEAWNESQDERDCVCPITGCQVTNTIYDVLRLNLKTLRANSAIFTTPSAAGKDSGAKKMKHDPPMTSIAKANGTQREKEERLVKFLQDCLLGLNLTAAQVKAVDGTDDAIFTSSIKHDGIACSLDYVKGDLKQAGLRPQDGVTGEIITENVKYVKGIPQKLPLPITCTIRGELECPKDVFQKLQTKVFSGSGKAYSNPRTHTLGGIRQFKDPKKTADYELSFMGYAILNLDNPPFTTEIGRAKWSNKVLKVPFVQTRPFKFSDLAEIEKNNTDGKFPWEIDGVVISVNNLESQEQLGRYGNSVAADPKGKLAWKFAEEEKQATISGLRWQTGRTGRATPVAEFPGILIDGTTVSNATAFNAGQVIDWGLGIGAVIGIYKSGKIIPYISKIIKKSPRPMIIDKCPSCGTTLIKRQSAGTLDLICPNKATCPAQNVLAFTHYLFTTGSKGVGESMIESLVSGGFIKTFADLYTLVEDNIEKAGWRERQAVLAIARINMISAPEKIKDNDKLREKTEKAQQKKKVFPLPTLIAAFGIPGAGAGTGDGLTDHFNGDFAAIRKATKDQFLQVPNIGDKTADSLVEWFKSNEKQLDALLEFVEPEKPKTGKLSGFTFVFTGAPPNGKEYWKDLVKDQGGKVGSSVSSKTDYVVIGTDAGQKADIAKDLWKKAGEPTKIEQGKPVLIEDIEDLEKLLGMR